MEAAATSTTPSSLDPITAAASVTVADDEPTRIQKRYESLVMVRTKATKGKGAWYWSHLVPLIQSSDTGIPKAVKLRCSLCDSLFSASNPSRTASEHLKRGTCPNFASPAPSTSNRKRPPQPPSSHHHNQIVLSGGKDDLRALAMLEDSVKKLKSPRPSGTQLHSALSLLADWLFEAAGSVAFSALQHPKFRAFLHHVGLPTFPHAEITGPRLDTRFKEVWTDSEDRIRDVLFFQLAVDDRRPRGNREGILGLVLNLPNGSSVFRRAVFIAGKVPREFGEEILWETVTGVCGTNVRRCAGIVSSKFRSGAVRELENRNPWMVNLPCQLRAFDDVVKDVVRELPVCRAVAENCVRISRFLNKSGVFRKYRVDESGIPTELAVVPIPIDPEDQSKAGGLDDAVAMMEDVLASGDMLHSVVMDEAAVPMDVAKAVRDVRFWNDLEAVLALVRMVREMARHMEVERPYVGQCLQLWDELRSKVKDWCRKFGMDGGPVGELIDKRFRKNYHPAWSAAFVLDPLYLTRDSSGKYLPPFKYLAPDQEKDVDRFITRLVSPEEKHIALMELFKWRSEGLDRDYALAVQIKQRDPMTGNTRMANPQISRLVWESHLREFKSLGKVAVRLIFLHATSRAFKCNPSFLRWVGSQRRRSREGMERAHKLLFVAANAKLERRDLLSEEEKDARLFGDQ